MRRRLTRAVNERMNAALHGHIGRRRITRFSESLACGHVLSHDVDSGYREMAGDKPREADAFHWAEATIHDVAGDLD